MTDDFDLRDIFLEATAEIQEVIREVMEELTEPQELEQIRQMWAAATDEQKEQIMRENPEEYKALMDAINERKSK
jgi:DNA-binding MarR family transcriptional regulator